jgi:methylenetetrahydrofolate dehydrogenase (NADP+) / methenyltetrahydrofolate cyclohydrolase
MHSSLSCCVATSSTARIIDGRALAQRYRAEVGEQVRALRQRGVSVSLDAILVDSESDPAAAASSPQWGGAARIYAENQRASCAELGIEYRLHVLPPTATYEDIAGRILLLNTDDRVTAIMLHLPVPEEIDPYRLQSLIDPAKDVEGVNPANIGNIVYGRSSLVPCTALAVMTMVDSTGIELRGADVCCVGASDIVGKPVAVLMMQREATVFSCNKHTRRIEDYTKRADVVIVAAGKPRLLTAEMVKPGAVVIDVGINRIVDEATGKKVVVGDVDFDGVKEVVGWLSPVPGGVGPMTVAMLLRNTVEAGRR